MVQWIGNSLKIVVKYGQIVCAMVKAHIGGWLSIHVHGCLRTYHKESHYRMEELSHFHHMPWVSESGLSTTLQTRIWGFA